uniref:Uncharacterized protein n=1 Tax=Arundo donax TaxID=35708 RepID=A0A0A8XMV5_ARUDO
MLHGHGCRCRCLTQMRMFDSANFSETWQITFGIRHGCQNQTRIRGV